MSRTTGEALREHIADRINEAQEGSLAVSAQVLTLDEIIGVTVAAIVEKLGITREMADWLDSTQQDACRALTALLDCAEVEP